VAIDKMEKIGMEKVNEELLSKGIPTEAIDKLQPVLHLKGDNKEKLNQLRSLLQNSDIGLKGIEEMETIFSYITQEGLSPAAAVELDLTLARGLNYYTGTIFEVKSLQVEMGSITGGGRYDNLTGIFGLPNMSGVGISFGIERIYDIWTELNKNKTQEIDRKLSALFVNFGKEEERYCLKALKKLRDANINAELFPEQAKLQKQMKYANAKNIPYVILAGEEELTRHQFTVKNMQNSEQNTVSFEDMVRILSR
jgi:histidyl-tRNA synthetase